MSDQSPNRMRPVRRAPNIVAFLASGALIGLLVGGFIGIRANTGNYTQSTAIALLAVIGAIVGAVVGGVAVALIEYRSLR
ncbi:hypothetical protein V3G39_04495 [Dermatophilaceae bacterium Sec6.4]|nr:hypothetical protein [Actinomycetota bacterium]